MVSLSETASKEPIMTSESPRSPSLVDKDTAILVIVDVQNKLVPVVAEAQRTIDNIVKLLKLARILSIPIIGTEQQNLGETVDAIRDELPDWTPVTKLAFSCFASADFVEQLASHQRRTLLLAGLEAHICIAQTALAAPTHFRVHVVGDAVAARSPEDRRFALDRLRQNGVSITSTEMLIYELLERAGTTEFRNALPLLKTR
jgi:isochorismate hydrolase